MIPKRLIARYIMHSTYPSNKNHGKTRFLFFFPIVVIKILKCTHMGRSRDLSDQKQECEIRKLRCFQRNWRKYKVVLICKTCKKVALIDYKYKRKNTGFPRPREIRLYFVRLPPPPPIHFITFIYLCFPLLSVTNWSRVNVIVSGPRTVCVRVCHLKTNCHLPRRFRIQIRVY